jgi:hypothetical protein
MLAGQQRGTDLQQLVGAPEAQWVRVIADGAEVDAGRIDAAAERESQVLQRDRMLVADVDAGRDGQDPLARLHVLNLVGAVAVAVRRIWVAGQARGREPG